MKEANGNIIYTADDIKRYITGAMTPAEMHAIEKAALDDPLLAEAMEGYDLMEQKDWSNELASLKQQIRKEENQEAPIVAIQQFKTFKWWKAAAAVLVLGTAATTAYLFTGNKENSTTQQLAKVEANTANTDSAASLPVADSIGAFANITTGDSAGQLTANANTITNVGTTTFAYTPTAPANDRMAGTDSNFIYRPDPSGGKLLAMKDEQTNVAAGAENVTESDAKMEGIINIPSPNAVAANNTANNNANYYKKNEIKAAAEPAAETFDKIAAESNNAGNIMAQHNFSGIILSPDNKPVSFASIKIPQLNKPVFTDANGIFKISAPDSALHVTITSAGYNSQKIILRHSVANNTIVLEPQVVATQAVGKARTETAKRKHQAFEDSTLISDEDAEPAGGWIEYNNYLSNNLRFPENARQKNIHGEVEVIVKLSNNGDVSQIKVDKPLSPDCDAEAIRLVKEGPKWDVKNTKKKKVKVKVKF